MPVRETKPRLPLIGTCPVSGKIQLFLARSALQSFQGREGPAAAPLQPRLQAQKRAQRQTAFICLRNEISYHPPEGETEAGRPSHVPEAIQLAASEWVALGFQGRATGGTFSSNFFFFFPRRQGKKITKYQA